MPQLSGGEEARAQAEEESGENILELEVQINVIIKCIILKLPVNFVSILNDEE